MSLRLNGTAWPTNSGSLSEAKVVPLLASESPSLLMANFFTEHPFASVAASTSSSASARCGCRGAACCARMAGALTPTELPGRAPGIICSRLTRMGSTSGDVTLAYEFDVLGKQFLLGPRQEPVAKFLVPRAGNRPLPAVPGIDFPLGDELLHGVVVQEGELKAISV